MRRLRRAAPGLLLPALWALPGLWALAALSASGCLADECAHDQAPDSTRSAAQSLWCTGLYRERRSQALAPDVLEFEPAYRLWSDGAQKRRWIRLPPGTAIDTRSMDEWVFPVGTRLWKEFSVDGRRVETRYLEKRGERDWRRVSFVWDEAEANATERPEGIRGHRGTSYEVPSSEACDVCHSGRIDGVLGFEAVSLAAEGARGLTWSELVARGWVTASGPPVPPVPPVPGNELEKSALGYLHVNCGTACHSPSPYSRANFVSVFFRLNVNQLGSVAATDTYRTALGYPSVFLSPVDGRPMKVIAPGDPEHSSAVYRAKVRDERQELQMPPVATHVVDAEGVLLLERWVRSLPAP